MKDAVIYIDVDDTLIRTVGTKRVPMVRVVELVRQLGESGAKLFLWSSGGAEYARATAEELGIADCFVACLPKPRVYVDDQCVSDWRYCAHVHPNELDTLLEEEGHS